MTVQRARITYPNENSKGQGNILGELNKLAFFHSARGVSKCLACLAFLSGALCVLTYPTLADTPSQRLNDVTQTENYQAEIPLKEVSSSAKTAPSPSPDRQPDLDENTQTESNDIHPEVFSSDSWNLSDNWLVNALWLVVIVAAVMIIFTLLREYLVRPQIVQAPPDQNERADRQKVEQQAGVELSDAGQLAAAGQYAEAVHQLLIGSLIELNDTGRLQLSEAATSREILRTARLESDAKTALKTLISTVELAHFGGRRVNLNTYETCSRHYDTLVSSAGGN